MEQKHSMETDSNDMKDQESIDMFSLTQVQKGEEKNY